MKKLFADLPEAILTTQEIVDKVEAYELAREVLLPKFDIPAEFIVVDDEQDALTRHGLTSTDIEFEVTESTAMVGHVGKENATLKT